MSCVDLLSDTVYREQAHKQLDDLLSNHGNIPVQKSQIYGLRQIARQAPLSVNQFADRQRERAERKLETVSRNVPSSLEAEIDFWKLVGVLCDERTPDWSVVTEGLKHIPPELRAENIRAKSTGRARRKQLRAHRNEWIDRWKTDHLPAFFERFCTHALYRKQPSRTEPVRTAS